MCEPGVYPLSLDAPFLSNLNVLDNIILVVDAKLHITNKSSKQRALAQLDRLGKSHLAMMHHTKLSARDYFLMQLVRANMYEEGLILIDRPFRIFSDNGGLEFIINSLETLEIEASRVTVMDQSSVEYRYREALCNIKKWS